MPILSSQDVFILILVFPLACFIMVLLYYAKGKEEKKKELLEKRVDELRSQISSSLISIDGYIKSLSSEGIKKKETLNKLSLVRLRQQSATSTHTSRLVNSQIAMFEEDLKTCKEDEDEARGIATLISTQQFDDYIDELATMSTFDERLSEVLLGEHRRLSDHSSQFDFSEYIELSKLKVERKVEDRKKEISEGLERERLERLERERLEEERLERERLERLERLEKLERLERERLKRLERERLERERQYLEDFKCWLEDSTTRQLNHGPTFSRTWSVKK